MWRALAIGLVRYIHWLTWKRDEGGGGRIYKYTRSNAY